MMHAIGQALRTELEAHDCPIPVVDGPETGKPVTWGNRIVIEHDPDGDGFATAVSQHKNPKMKMVRNVGGKLTIYAQSTRAGALRWEHEHRAEHILDLVLVGMAEAIQKRETRWTIGKGKFVQPADLEKSERPAGVAYELTFTVARGVFVQTWEGDARPEHTLGEGGITSCTHVSSPHGSESETACGPC